MNENKKFNLNLRDVLTFWEMIFLQQECGNDSSKDLHPALTTYLDLVFRLHNNDNCYHRPWVIRNALKYKNDNSPNWAGTHAVVTFLRECADVLEKELDKE